MPDGKDPEQWSEEVAGDQFQQAIAQSKDISDRVALHIHSDVLLKDMFKHILRHMEKIMNDNGIPYKTYAYSQQQLNKMGNFDIFTESTTNNRPTQAWFGDLAIDFPQ